MKSDPLALFAPVVLNSGIRGKDAWPLDPNIVHLNHGSFGAVPTEVVDRVAELHRSANLSPVGWFPRIGDYVAEAREMTAPFVGARAQDSVFVPNASAAASVVFNSLTLREGDEILVTNHGYGAITMGAERLARRFGARVRGVSIGLTDSAEVILETFGREITDRTRLIVVDQITSSTAKVLPTRDITKLAHTRGVKVLVDGAHAPGLVEDAATRGGGDWWLGNMHKWPGAPRGSALLVTTRHDRDELWPLIDSWGATDPYPQRFDVQGTFDATAYIATPAAIEFIEREYGWGRARADLQVMADESARAIAEALAPYMDRSPAVEIDDVTPAMRLIRLPEGLGRTREEADDFRMRILDEAGIETAFTSFDGEGYYRLSVHLYTEERDIEMFIDRGIPIILNAAGIDAPVKSRLL